MQGELGAYAIASERLALAASLPSFAGHGDAYTLCCLACLSQPVHQLETVFTQKLLSPLLVLQVMRGRSASHAWS